MSFIHITGDFKNEGNTKISPNNGSMEFDNIHMLKGATLTITPDGPYYVKIDHFTNDNGGLSNVIIAPKNGARVFIEGKDYIQYISDLQIDEQIASA